MKVLEIRISSKKDISSRIFEFKEVVSQVHIRECLQLLALGHLALKRLRFLAVMSTFSSKFLIISEFDNDENKKRTEARSDERSTNALR